MQRLIDANALEPDTEWDEYYDGFLSYSQSQIDAAPTIEAEPVRRGRWLNKGEYAVCSECGGRSGTQFDGVEPIPLITRFCEHCGAYMRATDTNVSGKGDAEKMTLEEAIGYIKVLCDAVSDQPCGCDACPYGDTVDDDGICEVWKAINKDGCDDNA